RPRRTAGSSPSERLDPTGGDLVPQHVVHPPPRLGLAQWGLPDEHLDGSAVDDHLGPAVDHGDLPVGSLCRAHAAASIPPCFGPAGGFGDPGPAGGFGGAGGGLGRGLAAPLSCSCRPSASASSGRAATVMSMTPRRHRDSDEGVVLSRWARSASLVAPSSAHRASMASKLSQIGRVGMTLTQSTVGMTMTIAQPSELSRTADSMSLSQDLPLRICNGRNGGLIWNAANGAISGDPQTGVPFCVCAIGRAMSKRPAKPPGCHARSWRRRLARHTPPSGGGRRVASGPSVPRSWSDSPPSPASTWTRRWRQPGSGRPPRRPVAPPPKSHRSTRSWRTYIAGSRTRAPARPSWP